MRERRRLRSPEQAGQPDLGGRHVGQVLATDDERDRLPEIVHHDTQGIGPVALSVPDREVTGNRHVPAGPGP